LTFLLGFITGGSIETLARSRLRRQHAASAHQQVEQIYGIGPAYAERLYAAGITSLRKLAATPKDKLFDIASAGRTNARIDPNAWIMQAETILKAS